jgi:hypothetical protein
VVRLEDGMRGHVEVINGENRVVYEDRGTMRVSPKREVWETEKTPPRKLREEDIIRVAATAERTLMALDKNEPDRYWEPLNLSSEPYDKGLRKVIVDYLSGRG